MKHTTQKSFLTYYLFNCCILTAKDISLIQTKHLQNCTDMTDASCYACLSQPAVKDLNTSMLYTNPASTHHQTKSAYRVTEGVVYKHFRTQGKYEKRKRGYLRRGCWKLKHT